MWFTRKQNVITDGAKIDEILTRSIDKIYPSKEKLKELLASGKQLKVYVGIDPTADYVHLGHSTNYIILKRLHELGHKIIVLVGDFTAMIGDPTDKTSTRTQLTQSEVQNNLKSFKQQIGKILNFNDRNNPIEFRFNSEWLSKLNFEKLVELAACFTVQQMVERDMFEKRIKDNKPLFVHEFFYPMMQGYDSVELDVDLEIGGTDQTFNMLAGRNLARKYLNKEKYVITTTLLENPVTGEKLMSKSLGTGVGLNESPDSMFGKVMALPDEGVIQTFIDCTFLPMTQIDGKRKRLETGENPKLIKIELAKEIVTMYHSKEIGDKAEINWTKTFSEKEIPDDIKTVSVSAGELLKDILTEHNLVPSKSEYGRLIEQGAIHNLTKKEKVTDNNQQITESAVYKVGKKLFIKIEVK
jgi:tyrosyl-tRNA synthetase